MSSLFGSQEGSADDIEEDKTRTVKPDQSPTETLRAVLRAGSDKLEGRRKGLNDRTRWKTLRDFVDERAIEDNFDEMESERNLLDVSCINTSPSILLTLYHRIFLPRPPTFRNR